MRFLAFAFGLVSLVVTGAPLRGQEPAWPDAIASGSQRLALFALMREKPAGAEPLVADLLVANGFAPDGGADLSWTLSPGLTWDENVNGGITATALNLYGLTFTIDEPSRAKAGLVPTLGVSSVLRKTVAPGMVVQGVALANLGYAPEHRMGRADLTFGPCAANHLGGDWFADLCARQTRRLRNLGNSTEQNLSVSAERLFAVGASLHSLTVKPQLDIFGTAHRGQIELGWIGVIPGVGTLNASLQRGQIAAGYSAVTHAARFGLKRAMWGAPTGVQLSVEQAEGQSYLGVPRRDQVYAILLSRRIAPYGEAQIGYRHTDSSIDGFGGGSVIVGFDFKGWDG